MYCNGEGDCDRDCDLPSEVLHTLCGYESAYTYESSTLCNYCNRDGRYYEESSRSTALSCSLYLHHHRNVGSKSSYLSPLYKISLS